MAQKKLTIMISPILCASALAEHSHIKIAMLIVKTMPNKRLYRVKNLWRRWRIRLPCFCVGMTSSSYPVHANSSFVVEKRSVPAFMADKDTWLFLFNSRSQTYAGSGLLSSEGVDAVEMEDIFLDGTSRMSESLWACKNSIASCCNFRLSVLPLLQYIQGSTKQSSKRDSRCLWKVIQV